MANRTIDKNYFQKYAGRNQDYRSIYEEHSGAPECIQLFQQDSAPKIKKICVLGAATGEVLYDFEDAFGVKPWGCEISDWAYGKIPSTYKRKVKHLDLVDYVDQLLNKKQNMDLVFSNSFVYLEKKEITPLFKKLSQLTKFIHFDSSFVGNECPDPYRQILETYQWWNSKFKRAGFQELRGVWSEKTFLWENKSL